MLAQKITLVKPGLDKHKKAMCYFIKPPKRLASSNVGDEQPIFSEFFSTQRNDILWIDLVILVFLMSSTNLGVTRLLVAVR